MEKVVLKNLVTAVKGKFVFGDPFQVINSISTDTRKLHPGDAFFALKGKNYDAHDFIIKAIEGGASALVISELDERLNKLSVNLPAIIQVKDTSEALGDFAAYYRRQFNPLVVAITGSNGKTTTREMLYSILSLCGTVLANKENFNNLIGLPSTLFELNKEHKYCVFELGISVKGEMDKLAMICKPDTAIITNIGRSHLEFLNSPEGVLLEKGKLFMSLSEDETAILNMTDTYLAGLKDKLKCRIVTYGLSGSENVYASGIETAEDGIKFRLFTGKESEEIFLPVQGKFNVMNALGAAAAAYSLNAGIQKIKQGLEYFKPPKMRMELIRLGNGAIIINDAYNANPDSMAQSLLNFIEAYPARKKIAVLGDMLELGEYSQKEHKLLGECLGKMELDEAYLYGDIIKLALQEGNPRIRYFPDKDALIARLRARIDKSTVVLFKASRRVGLEKIIEGLLRY